eukprot:m.56085 g.56085  ORF g.56085 m.56085 type:complete len:55 (+) comp7783_c1_seq1:999-1163(+)
MESKKGMKTLAYVFKSNLLFPNPFQCFISTLLRQLLHFLDFLLCSTLIYDGFIT